jgi:TP901 family phage tail tape measure protein
MSKVSAVSGATGKDLDDLRAKAREMGSKTKFSATEAAEAFNYMAMAGWKTGDMLEGIEGVMNLAAASGEDLATTSDIVTDALTAFGLSASDSGHFADILAAASSNANTNVSMMGETFKYVAPIAGALGYSAEDTALAIGLMANAGIKSSQAGTSLRKIMTELNGVVEISGKEIGKVQIATTNADGSMRDFNDILMDCREAFSHLTESEKAQAAEALVGKTAMSGFLAIMNATDEDVNKLSNSIANCDGEAQRMADTMNDNLEGQLTILKSALQELAISLGEVLVPIIRDVVAAIQNVVNWLNSLSPAAKETIVKIGLIVAAAGPLLIVVGKIITAVGSIMTLAPKIVSLGTKIVGVAKTIGTGLKALWGVMLANPITIVIAAIAALVAAFIYFWNTSEEFRQFWINLWETIKNAVAQFGEAIKQIWNNVVAWCAQAWENIKNVVSVAIQFLAELLTAAFELLMLPWRFLWENFGQYLIEAWEAIKTTIGNALTAIGTALENAWNAILAFMETILTAIGTAVSTAWEAIKATITSIMNAIKSAVTAGLNAIKSTAQNVWNSIKSTAESAWNGIKSTVSSVIGNIKSAVSSGLNAVKSTASNILNGIKNTFKTVWDGAVSLVRGAVDKLKSLVNFHWELPKLKLPHLSISGHFSINPPSVPHFSIEWYKKAMADGMILNSPTIFGAAGGRLLGGGEAGPEAVVGVDSLRSMIFDAVAAVGGGFGGDITIPVYIGQRKIDTIVVEAVQRSNYRSGGR